jgi:aminopeptidase N
MLREQIGDEAFFRLLRAYAETFRDRPATSLDFWQLAEQISGQDLGWFFGQWLLLGGMPRYTLFWTETQGGAAVLLCPADPASNYRLDLPLRFVAGDQEQPVTLEVRGPEARGAFDIYFAPADVVVDPDQNVLAQVQTQAIAALPEVCPAPGDEKWGEFTAPARTAPPLPASR